MGAARLQNCVVINGHNVLLTFCGISTCVLLSSRRDGHQTTSWQQVCSGNSTCPCFLEVVGVPSVHLLVVQTNGQPCSSICPLWADCVHSISL